MGKEEELQSKLGRLQIFWLKKCQERALGPSGTTSTLHECPENIEVSEVALVTPGKRP